MKKNKNLICIIISIIFFEIFMGFQLISNEIKVSNKYVLFYVGLCIISNVIGITSYLILNKKKNIKIEQIFLMLSILFGGLYLVFVPAMLGTDELPHYLRSYQISVGDVIVKHPERNSTLMPEELMSLLTEPSIINRYNKNNLFKPTDYNKKTNIYNGNVTSIKYSPIPYLPQVLGFWISRLLCLSPVLTLFCVRGVNLLVWIILGYFSIKLLPCKKTFATILYTSPAVLSLVGTCSGDAFALGLMFLISSYIFNLTSTKGNVTKKDYFIFMILSLLLSTYKMFYVIFLFLLFVIPNKKFKNIKQKLLFVLSIIGCSILVDYIWFSLTSINDSISNVEVTKQIHFILSNPLYYFMTFLNTFFKDSYYYISNLVGGSEMCYGIVKMNQIFIFVYLYILYLSFKSSKTSIKMNNISKIFICLICLAIIGLVSTALYVDWTSHKLGIGSNIIIGVQARYFIPLIIPLIMLAPSLKKNYKITNNYWNMVIAIDILLFINTINSIFIAISQS